MMRGIFAGLLVLVSFSAAFAGIAPENVAIVVNGDSEVSKTIASAYARLRSIPDGNIVTVTGLPDKEKLSVDDFRERLLGPVLKTLEERGLRPQIDVIAYSAEIPTAIDITADIGDRKVPRIFTPTASVNGLTFLHQAVMEKDIRYLDLNINRYARRVVRDNADKPWLVDEQKRYVEAMAKLQQYGQAVQQRKEGETPTDEEREKSASLLKEIATVFDELNEAHPRSADLQYNRACILAQSDRPEAAIAALREAARNGWSDVRHTERDDDLKSLRGRDDFKAIIEEMKMAAIVMQPATGFRARYGWNAEGKPSDEPDAPRYLLSTVLACTTGRGNSVDDALANLRKTAAADGSRPSGTIYFERNGDVRSTTREWAFRDAARQLEALGVKAVIEDGVLPKERGDVAGAVIGIADFDWQKSESKILAGAIVEHLTSFGGVMTSGAGQTPLTEFLKHGAAGSSGTVTEPFAIQAKFPTPFIHVHYASGCTLAEAFHQSVSGPYQLLIVGDPLAQPWRKPFSLEVEGLTDGKTVSAQVAFTPKTSSPASNGPASIGPASCELYVDGLRIESKAEGPLTWDSTKSNNGEHVVTIVARGNDAVETIARKSAVVVVQNEK